MVDEGELPAEVAEAPKLPRYFGASGTWFIVLFAFVWTTAVTLANGFSCINDSSGDLWLCSSKAHGTDYEVLSFAAAAFVIPAGLLVGRLKRRRWPALVGLLVAIGIQLWFASWAHHLVKAY